MSAAECRAARKARQEQRQQERLVKWRVGLAHHREWFTWKRDLAFGKVPSLIEKPKVDITALIARDKEREVMRALDESMPRAGVVARMKEST